MSLVGTGTIGIDTVETPFGRAEDPTTGLGAGLAAMEAIAGQLFLAILVARLVGLYIAQTRS